MKVFRLFGLVSTTPTPLETLVHPSLFPLLAMVRPRYAALKDSAPYQVINIYKRPGVSLSVLVDFTQVSLKIQSVRSEKCS